VSPALQSRFERLTQLKPPALPEDTYLKGPAEVDPYVLVTIRVTASVSSCPAPALLSHKVNPCSSSVVVRGPEGSRGGKRR
jgi:hypothetical protein